MTVFTRSPCQSNDVFSSDLNFYTLPPDYAIQVMVQKTLGPFVTEIRTSKSVLLFGTIFLVSVVRYLCFRDCVAVFIRIERMDNLTIHPNYNVLRGRVYLGKCTLNYDLFTVITFNINIESIRFSHLVAKQVFNIFHGDARVL